MAIEIDAERKGKLALPQIYNRAVQDARKFMQERLDDMDGEVREVEG